MRIAVVSAVYNEEKTVGRLLDALLRQTRLPDEILVVDDGSTDGTADEVRRYAKYFPRVKYLYQRNRGPAAARNLAWPATSADVCVFTDADCVPEPYWLEKLSAPFESEEVGAAGGGYKTLNTGNLLARFVGLEIAWRYRNVRGRIDVHGSYNLAIRRHLLEEVGGYNEEYRVPSGEDWDLTYKISRLSKMLYVPEAVVGHDHPESFWPYLKLQVRRAFDRVKVYNDHPDKRSCDAYTNRLAKYQALAAGAFLPSIALAHPFFGPAWLLPAGLSAFLAFSTLLPFRYFYERDKAVAFYSLGIQFLRNFCWFLGAFLGIMRFGWVWKARDAKTDAQRKLEQLLAA